MRLGGKVNAKDPAGCSTKVQEIDVELTYYTWLWPIPCTMHLTKQEIAVILFEYMVHNF